ncbi:hypothetical protein R3P38DRAFT_69556 [Favolaschia claudopus]|uniref:BHLH domain-containing protein n=1 Tax=Favolaschia claudopus TaxID=2862362 RepID=A0AAW0D3Y2_9AGAR
MSQTPSPNDGTPKRSSRYPNHSERRATHNAVERVRREALNQKLLTLASLLPPTATFRRPSKNVIINSAIATLSAGTRHRVQVADELRSLNDEAERLRMEVNEWRARAQCPPLEITDRSPVFQALMRGESVHADIEERSEPPNDDEEDSDEEDTIGTSTVILQSPQDLGHTYGGSGMLAPSSPSGLASASPPSHVTVAFPFGQLQAESPGSPQADLVYGPGHSRHEYGVGHGMTRTPPNSPWPPASQDRVAAQLQDVYEQQRQILQTSAAMIMALPFPQDADPFPVRNTRMEPATVMRSGRPTFNGEYPPPTMHF